VTTLYKNFLAGVIDAGVAPADTTLNGVNLSNLPTITGSDNLWLVLDPTSLNGAPEVVLVTAHSASATSCTITRGLQGTTARTHPAGTRWVNTLTAADFALMMRMDAVSTKGDLIVATGAGATTVVPAGTVPGTGLVVDASTSTGLRYGYSAVEYLILASNYR